MGYGGVMSRFPTAPIVAAGLIGGFAVAQASGNRPLGGAVLAAGGVAAAYQWYQHRPALVATGLVVTYVGAFAVSHPLSKEIGAWPSVLAVTAVASGAALVCADTRPSKHGSKEITTS